MPRRARVATFAAMTEERGQTAGRILLVEPDDLVLDMMQRVLAPYAREVLATSSARRAAELLAVDPAPIDVLLAELALYDPATGRCGAAELARSARRHRPEIRVVLLSSVFDARAGAALPVDATVLGKPFTPDELLTCVGVAR